MNVFAPRDCCPSTLNRLPQRPHLLQKHAEPTNVTFKLASHSTTAEPASILSAVSSRCPSCCTPPASFNQYQACSEPFICGLCSREELRCIAFSGRHPPHFDTFTHISPKHVILAYLELGKLHLCRSEFTDHLNAGFW